MFNETMHGVINATARTHEFYGAGHHSWGMMHGSVSILLTIAFVLLLVWLFRRGAHGQGLCGHNSSASALATLSERFAKGEIDEEEFRAKRDVLKSRK